MKQVSLSELFEQVKVKKVKDVNKVNNGCFPLVSASRFNNGISQYIDAYDIDGLYITVVSTGDGGAGYCFVQNGKFSVASSVLVFKPKLDYSNRLNELKLISCIISHQLHKIYSRTVSLTNERFLKEVINYPSQDLIDKINNNFNSILSQINHLTPSYGINITQAPTNSTTETRSETRLSTPNGLSNNSSANINISIGINTPNILKAFSGSLKPFKLIGELFNYECKGKIKNITTISESRFDQPHYPLISAKSTNNGIYKYIPTYNHDEYLITIATNGSVGATFLQTYKFSACSDVSVLKPILTHDIEKLKMICFIVSKQLMRNYNWGIKLKRQFMEKEIIYIPESLL